MFQQGLVKCLSLFFIVFLMCPKRVRLTVGNKEDYYNAVQNSNKDIDVTNVNLRSRHSDRIAIEDSNEMNYLVDELGFDLTDDEMRKFRIWPKGIIPYYIDAISFSDKVLRDRIRRFLNTVNKLTKLSFLELPAPPKDDKTRWVFFANRRGQLDCGDHSVLNMTNEGVQHVVLGYDCLAMHRELAEAVLSIVGVANQHNSPDRDKHIKVVYENILPDKKYLFEKLEPSSWLFYDIEYDINSAGHFHHHRYSKNGQATIVNRQVKLQLIRKPEKMSDGVGLTKDDIRKIRMLYTYIVNKKENQVPECGKLFKKGENFQPVILPEDTPRKKPDQYLGITTPITDYDDPKYSDDDSSSQIDEVKPLHLEMEEDDKLEVAGSRIKYDHSAPKKGNFNPVKYRDPLLYLSDYQTGDEYRRNGKAQKNST